MCLVAVRGGRRSSGAAIAAQRAGAMAPASARPRIAVDRSARNRRWTAAAGVASARHRTPAPAPLQPAVAWRESPAPHALHRSARDHGRAGHEVALLCGALSPCRVRRNSRCTRSMAMSSTRSGRCSIWGRRIRRSRPRRTSASGTFPTAPAALTLLAVGGTGFELSGAPALPAGLAPQQSFDFAVVFQGDDGQQATARRSTRTALPCCSPPPCCRASRFRLGGHAQRRRPRLRHRPDRRVGDRAGVISHAT